MSLFRLENVVHTYRERGTARTFEALRVHELAIERGEVLTVVGPNGSGKSTLLELTAFLHRPGSGRILLDGIDPWQTGGELAARRRCPILLQQTTLFATTVLKNVMLPLKIHGFSRSEVRTRAHEALDLVRLADLLHRRHDELSVGQKRRVALARILALRSPVVLLDEPTASLDQDSERLIETVIRDVNQDRGATVIMASHNYRQAVALSTRVVTLLAGRLIPEALDNVLWGTMRPVEAGYEFRDRDGWSITFDTNEMIRDEWEGIGPVDGPVQIAIAASSVTLEADAADTAARLAGRIEAVRTSGNACRLRVRLDNGRNFHAEIPGTVHDHPELSPGRRVGLALSRQAVRVIRETD